MCAHKRESLQERLSFAKCGIKKGDEHRPGDRRRTGWTTVGENFHSYLIEVFKGEEDRKLSQHNGGKSCFEVALKTKICIKYRKHGISSFSHSFVCVC